MKSQQSRIRHLISAISSIRDQGYHVILVSSGAISSGMDLMSVRVRPRDLPQLQSLAAIGQSRLMSLYENACRTFGYHCAQILLSHDDLKSRKRHLNLCNCVNALLSKGILPIINENDAVSTDEISFGDNDKLAALVATMTRADLTILLTTVDGFFLPGTDDGRKRISIVDRVTADIRNAAEGTDGNPRSTGGMISKLMAAEICMAAGESLWIANGTDFAMLQEIWDARDVGTLFYSKANKMPNAKRWLAFFTEPAGALVVDDGAVRAIAAGGKSLLPSGIVSQSGSFDKGDTVNLTDVAGKTIAMGITNYNVDDIVRIKGLKSQQVIDLLDERAYTEVVHRDNMVITQRS